MLVSRILLLEIVPNLHNLLTLLVKHQELIFQLIGPNFMQLKSLILKTSFGLKLLIASHRIVQSVQLHFPNSRL